MKYKYTYVLMSLILSLTALAQFKADSTKMYLIIQNGGAEAIGKIIRSDERELLIETKNVGRVIIPKYEIKEIKVVTREDFAANGDYVPAEVFSTRYFLTTNGLPMEKGESYVQWNWFGPDFQFAPANNLGVGLMTTWVGAPILLTTKYSIPLGPVNLAVGTVLGTGSWGNPEFGIALPYGALTIGDRRANLTISGGYGYLTVNGKGGGRVLWSIAGMTKFGRNVSLVFDSFIMTTGRPEKVQVTEYRYDYSTGQQYANTHYETRRKPGMALIIPGLRLQTHPNRAFQFGFMGMSFDGEFAPVPLPMVQWYRKL